MRLKYLFTLIEVIVVVVLISIIFTVSASYTAQSLEGVADSEFLSDVDFVKFSIVYTRSLAMKDEKNSYALVLGSQSITLEKEGTSNGTRLPNLNTGTFTLKNSTISSGTGTLYLDKWGTPIDDYSFTISSDNGLQMNFTILGKTGYIQTN